MTRCVTDAIVAQWAKAVKSAIGRFRLDWCGLSCPSRAKVL